MATSKRDDDARGARVRADDDDPSSAASASARASCAPLSDVVAFHERLRGVFGWQLLAFVFSADFFVKGAAKHMISTTSLPYAQRYLKFSAQAFQRFEVLVSFPWMLKPFIGMVTDTTPVFGYRKRYYLATFAVTGLVAIIVLATKTFSSDDATWYTVFVLATNMLLAFGDSLAGARVFEAMSEVQRIGGDLMTYSWTVATVGSIFGTLLAYIGLSRGDYKLIFWLVTPFVAQFAFTTAYGLLPEERVGSDFNAHALAKKYWNVFVVTITITLASVGVVSMQLVDAFETDLALCVSTCFGILLIMTGVVYAHLERDEACLLIYVAVDRVLGVNVRQAKTYWYTEGAKCVPDGPHFSYVFYSVTTFLFSLGAQMIGIWLFQKYLSRSKIRSVFLACALTKVIAKLGDIWIILRWNIAMGIDDRSAYVMGEGIIEGIAYVLTYMPATAVLSKIVDKEVSCTMYTLLAGVVNVASGVALTLGSASMTFVGIHTDLVHGHCNFDQLIPLLIVSGIILPLFSIPLIYVLIPDWCMHDDRSGSIEESVKAEEKK